MITFKQFLEARDATSMEDSELKDLLENDCAFFLEESKRKGFLIRGVNRITRGERHELPDPSDESKTVPFWEIPVRQDRTPSDTSIKTHELLDNWFNKVFKIKARTQALFCTGSSPRGVSHAHQYGDPYIIMPIGEFKYVWSNEVPDLYNKTAGINWSVTLGKDVDPEDKIDKFMNRLDYTDEDLHIAVQDHFEIMVGCRKYYAFEYSDRELLEMLLKIA